MTYTFCAIDTPDLEKADALAHQLLGHVFGLKLGLEFFLKHGQDGYKRLARSTMPLFLDLKLHDIPTTVAGAVTSLLSLQPSFLTLHTSGGAAMMEAAANAAAKNDPNRPKLLGVTVLTSLNATDLTSVGQDSNTLKHVVRLAKLAKDAGMDGIVCSPQEVKVVREELGPSFILMVPGIRPSWAASHDQKRVMTPAEAIRLGATYLVIGRPITGADDPVLAADRIQAELS